MQERIAFMSPLILIIIINQLFLSTSLNEPKIDIPSQYVSDTTFLYMISKNPAPSKMIYASPKGSGSTCSRGSPCSLKTAVESLKKGYILYLKGGKYDVKSGINIESSGTSKQYIVISSAPDEKAIITSSSKSNEISLFEISGSYIIIQNLTFKNVQAKNVQGIVFYGGGQNHVIIRNNIFDSLKTPEIKEDYGANGILLMGEEEKPIKQIIIYQNILTNNVLGYSEAISVAGNCEEIYVLKNTLKNNSNIGIDFYGNAKYCKKPELDQPRKSVAMYNQVEKSVSTYDSCAGLYVDGARDIYLAENTILNSQYGIEIGSEEKNDKYPVKNIIVKKNILKGNSATGIRIGGYKKQSTGIVQDCDITENTISGSPNGVIISKAQNINLNKNIFTGIDKYFIDMEFSSSYTKNIKIENNNFSGTGRFRLYGSTKLELNDFVAKYPTNKKK